MKKILYPILWFIDIINYFSWISTESPTKNGPYDFTKDFTYNPTRIYTYKPSIGGTNSTGPR